METRKTYNTLAEAVEDLKRRGFTAHFEWQENAFREAASRRSFQPEELTIVEHHRFEGPSDPSYLSVVYAIEAQDGTRGVVTDAFGAYATAGLGGFLKSVPLREAR